MVAQRAIKVNIFLCWTYIFHKKDLPSKSTYNNISNYSIGTFALNGKDETDMLTLIAPVLGLVALVFAYTLSRKVPTA